MIEIEKKLENGSTVLIKFLIHNNKIFVYDVGVKEKRKRTFRYLKYEFRDELSYRELNEEQRKKYEIKKYTEYMPLEVLNEALFEAWETCRPEPFVLDNEVSE